MTGFVVPSVAGLISVGAATLVTLLVPGAFAPYTALRLNSPTRFG